MKVTNAQKQRTSSAELLDKPEAYFEKLGQFKSKEQKRKQARLIDDLVAHKREVVATEGDRHLLFSALGLMLSLLFIILMFEWKFYDASEKVNLDEGDTRFEDVLDIPLTEQTPPPPPQQNQPLIITSISDEVEVEDLELNLDVEITEEMSIADPVQVDLEENLPEEEAEEIFVIVETKPEPVGGMSAFYEYLKNNLKYPSEARHMGISGRVYVQFVVEKDGSISSIEVVKGIGGGCDEEAARVLSESPRWQPGKQRGRPVKVRLTIPIFFTMAR